MPQTGQLGSGQQRFCSVHQGHGRGCRRVASKGASNRAATRALPWRKWVVGSRTLRATLPRVLGWWTSVSYHGCFKMGEMGASWTQTQRHQQRWRRRMILENEDSTADCSETPGSPHSALPAPPWWSHLTDHSVQNTMTHGARSRCRSHEWVFREHWPVFGWARLPRHEQVSPLFIGSFLERPVLNTVEAEVNLPLLCCRDLS